MAVRGGPGIDPVSVLDGRAVRRAAPGHLFDRCMPRRCRAAARPGSAAATSTRP